MNQKTFELMVSLLYLKHSIEKVENLLQREEVAEKEKKEILEEGSSGDGRFSRETKSFLS